MKKVLALWCLVAVGVCFFSGCMSVDWEEVSYQTPASKANLRANSKIRLVALDNKPVLEPLIGIISKELAGGGQFEVTDGKPDYWLAFSSNQAFRKDDRKAQPYNRSVRKVIVEDEKSGYEKLTKAEHLSSTATMLVSVAVYSVKDLSPVYYFDIEIYDADFSEKSVRDSRDYAGLFVKQVVAKIKDAFVCQKRDVKTGLPYAGDSRLRHSISDGDVAYAKRLGKELVPESFEKFMKDVAAGKYAEDEEGLEKKLCNYYMVGLAEEIDNYEASNLRRLHKMHVMILNQTQEDGLITAVPNTLARLEAKMKLMQTLK